MTRTPELGSVLKWLREKKGLLQKDVAKTVGVTVTTAHRWEDGEPPKTENARALEELFGLPPGVISQLRLLEEQLAAAHAVAASLPQIEEKQAELLDAVRRNPGSSGSAPESPPLPPQQADNPP